MPRPRKTLLFISLAAVAFLLLLAAVLAISLDRVDVDETLRARMSAAFAKPVSIKGGVELHLLPPGASFRDVTVGEGKGVVLRAKRLGFEVALWPLLLGEVRPAALALQEPVLNLRRDEGGRLKPGEEGGGSFAIGRVSVKNGSLRYVDAGDGTTLEAQGLDFELEEVVRDDGGDLSLSGQIRGGQFRFGAMSVQDLAGELRAEQSRFRLESLRCLLFGNAVEGRVEIDLQGESPTWEVTLGAEAFALDKLFSRVAEEALFAGEVKVALELSGETGDVLGTMDGGLELSGTDLVQRGFDLDRFIRTFRDSRDIDLVDVGIYAFAGPVGAVVGKGVDMARMVWAANREDEQKIEELVFDWSLRDGVADAEDVALRTRENRLALQGTVDLAQGRYDNLTLGLLNAEGCAELTEKITGPLSDPEVEKASMLGTLAGSLVGVLRQGWEIVDLSECEPYYQGSVEHPNEDGEKGLLPWRG